MSCVWIVLGVVHDTTGAVGSFKVVHPLVNTTLFATPFVIVAPRLSRTAIPTSSVRARLSVVMTPDPFASLHDSKRAGTFRPPNVKPQTCDGDAVRNPYEETVTLRTVAFPGAVIRQ